MEVIGLAAASLFSKYRKIATFDELLERLFFTGKTCVAVLLLFFGVPHLVSYLLVWAGTSLPSCRRVSLRSAAGLVRYFFIYVCGS